MKPSAERTSVKFVHNQVEPSSLVIHDGTTTLVFSPAEPVGGVDRGGRVCRGFAETLVRSSGVTHSLHCFAGQLHWSDRCDTRDRSPLAQTLEPDTLRGQGDDGEQRGISRPTRVRRWTRTHAARVFVRRVDSPPLRGHAVAGPSAAGMRTFAMGAAVPGTA